MPDFLDYKSNKSEPEHSGTFTITWLGILIFVFLLILVVALIIPSLGRAK